MSNLLEETLDVLAEHGQSPDDVLWCGSPEFGWFSWSDFAELADIEYDPSFGAAEVAQDLMIAGGHWHLTRGEYDGSEWWDATAFPPDKPDTYRKPVRLTVDGTGYIGWESLSGLHDEAALLEAMQWRNERGW